MTWLVAALVARLRRVSAAAVAVLQKEILQRHLRSIYTLHLVGGVTGLVIGLIFVFIIPGVDEAPLWPIGAALALGLLNSLLGLAILKGMHLEDVSRAIPVIDSYPLFVSVLAVLFLDEKLGLIQWGAIAAIVAGAFLALWHAGLPGERMRLSPAFLLLVMASFTIAIYNVSAKYLLDYLTLWPVYALTMLGSAPVIAAVALATKSWKEAGEILTRHDGRFYRILALQVLGVSSFIIWFVAAKTGPVSLVSAVSSARPVMVFAYVVFIKLLSDFISHRPLFIAGYRFQAVAAALVALGVAAIGLK